MEKVYKIIPLVLIGFAMASHLLTFVGQLLSDLHKDKPGWIDSVSTAMSKIVAFLNGVKAPEAVEAPKA